MLVAKRCSEVFVRKSKAVTLKNKEEEDLGKLRQTWKYGYKLEQIQTHI